MSNTKHTPEAKSVYTLKLHEIMEVTEPPYFRVMRVPTGWLYNFYDGEKDGYGSDWIFVIHPNSLITN